MSTPTDMKGLTKREAAEFGSSIGITIRWNSEWQEFQVYPKGTGKDHPAAYFTGCVEDACLTAMEMAK